MTQLIHHPEGDHNPYDPAPWSRRPLYPTTGENVTVGVKREGTLDGVFVEWETNGDHGRKPLDREGEAWSGEIGPFSNDARYRFTNGDDITDWYQIRPRRSDTYRFTAVRQLDDTMEA
ncbi:MAG TPA: hypothetical protein VE569_02170, partial [Acidimicrobiia bacterium]|nr:hypothetical protein [Acidimicrobiia bacterium]